MPKLLDAIKFAQKIGDKSLMEILEYFGAEERRAFEDPGQGWDLVGYEISPDFDPLNFGFARFLWNSDTKKFDICTWVGGIILHKWTCTTPDDVKKAERAGYTVFEGVGYKWQTHT